jgi:hypothetical protein
VAEVLLYSRAGCHLCEQARAILDRLAGDYRFTVREIDIDSDRDAFLAYCFSIPVVKVGESTVEVALDEHRLRSVFDWELRDERAGLA